MEIVDSNPRQIGQIKSQLSRWSKPQRPH